MTGPETCFTRAGTVFFATHLDSTTSDLDLQPAARPVRPGLGATTDRHQGRSRFATTSMLSRMPPSELATEHQFSARDVSSVSCRLHPGQFSLVVDPIDVQARPPNSPYAAQFSAPYVVAVALARRQFTLGDLAADRLNDPDVLDPSVADQLRCGSPQPIPGLLLRSNTHRN